MSHVLDHYIYAVVAAAVTTVASLWVGEIAIEVPCTGPLCRCCCCCYHRRVDAAASVTAGAYPKYTCSSTASITLQNFQNQVPGIHLLEPRPLP